MQVKLKTLKDLAFVYTQDKDAIGQWVVPMDDLNQEAIKWIKEERIVKANAKEGLYDIYTQEERWMKRLDITEEDLK